MRFHSFKLRSDRHYSRRELNIQFLDSPGEANASHEILEPRIGAQRIKAGPHEDLRVKALRIGLFEPGHRLLLLVQTYEDQGNHCGI